MRSETLHSQRSQTWDLVRRQHGVIARPQLVALGWTHREVERRIANGRLHRLFRGVYAVGRPDVTREGRWMAATLAAGDHADLSHGDGAAHYGIRPAPAGPIHVTVPPPSRRSYTGIVAHRRVLLPHERNTRAGIPIVTVEVVLTDLAAELSGGALEAAINEADVRGLITIPMLRRLVDAMAVRSGRRALRDTLDRRTFTFTRSHLERALIPIALGAGLPMPATGQVIHGFEVDFLWVELGLVVETDGLTYHRTPQQQAIDRRRDQALTAAGFTVLRFTHSQIRYEPGYVGATLRRVAAQLARPE